MNTVPQPAPTRYRYDVATRQSIGAREAQEDAALVHETAHGGLLAAVADGMGGHVGGAEASRIVCSAVSGSFGASSPSPVAERLNSAIDNATIALADGIRMDAALDGMGATLVSAFLDQHHLWWASVGDSRLYLFRNGRVRLLNQDHSMAPILDTLVERGELTRFEAHHHPNRHTLRSALTGYVVDMRDVTEEPTMVLPGDWLVVASDGMDTIDDDTLCAHLSRLSHASAEKMASALLDVVAEAKAPFQDNTTIITIKVEAEPHTEGSEAAA